LLKPNESLRKGKAISEIHPDSRDRDRVLREDGSITVTCARCGASRDSVLLLAALFERKDVVCCQPEEEF
jgi:hypothetical protein